MNYVKCLISVGHVKFNHLGAQRTFLAKLGYGHLPQNWASSSSMSISASNILLWIFLSLHFIPHNFEVSTGRHWTPNPPYSCPYSAWSVLPRHISHIKFPEDLQIWNVFFYPSPPTQSHHVQWYHSIVVTTLDCGPRGPWFKSWVGVMSFYEAQSTTQGWLEPSSLWGSTSVLEQLSIEAVRVGKS